MTAGTRRQKPTRRENLHCLYSDLAVVAYAVCGKTSLRLGRQGSAWRRPPFGLVWAIGEPQYATICLAGQARSAFAAFSTVSTWPGTFTLRQICLIVASAPMRKVARSTPMYLRPYMFFSTHTP